MNPQEQKIQELEQRIQKLENPQVLPQRWIELMIANGFFKADTILTLSQGVQGRFFDYLIGRVFNKEKTIGLTENFNRFYVTSGDEDIHSVNRLVPTNQVLFGTTGTLPAPLNEGSLYTVLTADTDSFTLEDPMSPGNPITFTNTGVGTHYYYFI